MRFALVDDEVPQLELIKTIISTLRHECNSYSNGQDLIKVLRRESYDFLIMDWELPDIKGPEVVKWVRENKSKTVPILLLTVVMNVMLLMLLTVGADDYIRKPIRIHEMVGLIEALIRRINPSVNTANKYSSGKYTFLPEGQGV